MNCFFCKGEIEDALTTYMVDLGATIIIIKDVPCHRCSQCGEESFTGSVVEKIEQIVESLKVPATEFAIVHYDVA